VDYLAVKLGSIQHAYPPKRWCWRLRREVNKGLSVSVKRRQQPSPRQSSMVLIYSPNSLGDHFLQDTPGTVAPCSVTSDKRILNNRFGLRFGLR
jgi:hypothetical protein